MAQSIKLKDKGYKLIGLYLLAVVIVVAFMFCGCSTKRSTESSVDLHRMALMTQRMDSMLRSSQTWQQSIYMQQQSLVDSFKHSEVRDTSRTVFLNEKKDTVKEVIKIREVIEREHSLSENKESYFEERFRQTDSLLQVSLAKQEKMDSTLQSYKKDTVVEKKPSLGERLKWIGIGAIVALLAAFAFFSAFMKKR